MNAKEGQRQTRFRMLASGGFLEKAIDVRADVHGSEVRRCEWVGHSRHGLGGLGELVVLIQVILRACG